MPDVKKENVLAFATFLRGPEFTSATATELANKFDLILAATLTINASQYYAVGNEAENIASRLPTSEKGKANDWIQSRGGTALIH